MSRPPMVKIARDECQVLSDQIMGESDNLSFVVHECAMLGENLERLFRREFHPGVFEDIQGGSLELVKLHITEIPEAVRGFAMVPAVVYWWAFLFLLLRIGRICVRQQSYLSHLT